MVTLSRLFYNISKGRTYYYGLSFSFPASKSPTKKDYIKEKALLTRGVKTCLFRTDPFSDGKHNKFNVVASLKVASSLRKHAYSNIVKILSLKNENFQIKNSDIF